jgi:hypothetical protein
MASFMVRNHRKSHTCTHQHAIDRNDALDDESTIIDNPDPDDLD